MGEDGSEEEDVDEEVSDDDEEMSDDDDDGGDDEEVSDDDGDDESLDELDDEEFEGDDLELGGEGGDDSSDGAGEDEFDADDAGDDDEDGDKDGEDGEDEEGAAAAAAAAASRGEQGGANMFGFAKAFSSLVGDGAGGDGAAAGDVLPKTKKQRRQEAELRREKKARAADKKRKLELRERGHVVPVKGVADPASDQLERKLLQTATRGVVRLFNAVSQAQRAAAEKKTDGNAKKKDMTKAEFLAQLRNSALGRPSPMHRLGLEPVEKKEEEPKAGKWDVLTDGYLMGRNKLKDWDKGTREDGTQEVEYEDEDEM